MEEMQGNVLVIGGGIAGIQTSLDLTELGFKVYLVEIEPTIGGTMAKLDKTFPTLDCSLCILAPKMVEVYRNPNIRLLTYSYIEKIDGEPGNYKVKIVQKPRYVKDNCNGCGTCIEVCPSYGFNSFNKNMNFRKAIYIAFEQAVPSIAQIDMSRCIECEACKKACTLNAIDFSQKEEILNASIGAIVVATGWIQENSTIYSEIGGHHLNVLSSLQYERLMCANGPTGGNIIRLDDGKHPHSIAFLQCIGSRDYHHPECKKYCSAICCMSAAKQAIITKEHAPDIECLIFNTELRAKGKNFYEFIEKSKSEYNVKYINGRVTFVKENPKTGDLRLFYENINDGIIEKTEVDMVILASALFPNSSYYKFLNCLNGICSDLGYITEESALNLEKINIFFTGYSRKPKDIPTSVAEGSACAAKISEKLYPVRFQNIKEYKYPSERPVNHNDVPRVGVLVCRCGINIGGIIDTQKVVNYASKLPYVVCAAENMYSCSSDSQNIIKKIIDEYKCNRFIVAACTPRTHEQLFQNTLREARLNPFLFDFVNIRDQNSWVHQKEPKKATKKACDLIRMSLAKIINAKPVQRAKILVEKSVLIIGGGISGIVAANNLCKQGFGVYLVEKDSILGGRSIEFIELYNLPVQKIDFLKELNELKTYSNVCIILNAKITDIHGFIGSFTIKVQQVLQDESKIWQFKVGTIIVATGTSQLNTDRWQDLTSKYPDRIITQNEFELKKDTEVFNFKDATIILCVDQRKNEFNQGEGVKTYCSNICCIVALKNIEKLLRINPNAHIHVLYRELQFSDLNAEMLWRDIRKRATFERYKSIGDIKIALNGEDFHFKYYNEAAQTEIEFDTNLIILATPRIPSEGTSELAKMLKVPLTKDGFFLEAHLKLRPIDFATPGIFLCGSAHWPKWIDESISQGYAAAARAAMIMAKEEIETEGFTSYIDESKCIGCGICTEICPYKAIEILEENKQIGIYSITKKRAFVITANCKGCGTCVSECPVNAIDQNCFSKNQISNMIDVFIGIENEKII